MRRCNHCARLAVCLLLLFLFLPAMTLPASAAPLELPTVENVDAALFYHVESGAVILSENADLPLPAGATPKLLSGLLFCEKLGHRLTDEVYITKEMTVGLSGYQLGIKPQDRMTVEQLLYAAICGSYNDAYQALAIYVSESVPNFVTLMNDRAKELGCSYSVFTDPSGVADTSVTTASELLLIAKVAFENETYIKITGSSKYQFDGTDKLPPTTINNRNALISPATTAKYFNRKCVGMCAGTTTKGKNSAVAAATNGTDSYLSVVLGGIEEDEKNYGYLITNRMIDWAYKTYTYMEVLHPDAVVTTLPVTVSDLTTEVEIRTDESLSAYLPANAEIGKEITYSVRLLYDSIEAPFEEHTFVGYVAVFYNGTCIGTSSLYTSAGAERSRFVGALRAIRSITGKRGVIAGFVFFVVCVTAWITVEAILRRKRHHKWDKYFSDKVEVPPSYLRRAQRK